MLNALSFDVEEWYHAELVRKHVPPQQRVSRAESAMDRVLDLLARYHVRATFFLVGELVQQHPSLVRSVLEAGHEIGCHGMTHRPLWELTADAFRNELREFRELMDDVMPTSAPPLIGFRAPTFSLSQRTAWALSILHEEGFVYDSSVFPAHAYLYGLPGASLSAYRPSTRDLCQHDPAGPLVELPVTVWDIAGQRLPIGGGFYLRVLPAPALWYGLHDVARRRPLVVYAHPWELDPETPGVRGLNPLERFITYANQGDMLRRLERLLREFSFAPLRDVLAVQEAGS